MNELQTIQSKIYEIRGQRVAVQARSRSQIVTLNTVRGSNIKYLPYAFTEFGVAMLSSILKSEMAINVNRAIMRAFVEFRHLATSLPLHDTTQDVNQLRKDFEELKLDIEDILRDQNDINVCLQFFYWQGCNKEE